MVNFRLIAELGVNNFFYGNGTIVEYVRSDQLSLVCFDKELRISGFEASSNTVNYYFSVSMPELFRHLQYGIISDKVIGKYFKEIASTSL